MLGLKQLLLLAILFFVSKRGGYEKAIQLRLTQGIYVKLGDTLGGVGGVLRLG